MAMPRKPARGRRKPAARRAAARGPSHPAVAELAAALEANKKSGEQQAATAQILRAMAKSPGDPQPVFDVIVEKAHRLCDAAYTVLYRYERAELAIAGSRHVDAKAMRALSRTYPQKPDREKMIGRAVLEGKVLHTPDITRDARFPRTTGVIARRSLVAMPLLQRRRVLGAISCGRLDVRPFSKTEIRLLKSFADQAVIAIENARLFNETREALEQQTATADVLRVISSSPSSVQPVFEAILDKAMALCEAHLGLLFLLDGTTWRLMSHRGASPKAEEAHRSFQAGPHTGLGRMLRERQPVHIEDLVADGGTVHRDPVRMATIELLGARTFLAAPLLKDGEVIGAVVIYRREVRPFREAQIRLLGTFADQAVIAIENVRLFNETREALERQTATAGILRVIAGTPTDTQPVFDAIVEATRRLVAGKQAGLLLREGSTFSVVGYSGSRVEDIPEDVRNVPLDRTKNFPSRAILDAQVVHVTDWEADDVPDHEKKVARTYGIKSGLIVPLLRKGEGIGALVALRAATGAYHEKEIALLRSFADQAVIAIENVRLFNETTEALERQTATGEILASISGSMENAQPVFDTIVRSLGRLFGTAFSAVFIIRDGQLDIAAAAGEERFVAVTRAAYPLPVDDEDMLAVRAMRRAEVLRVCPIVGNPEAPPKTVRLARASGYDSIIVAPMLREGVAIGVIATARTEAVPFDDRQVELIKSFADQAVIAIENARLFNETKEALERQTATADVLRVISSSPADVKPVFDAIVQSAMRLVGGFSAVVTRFDGHAVQLEAFSSINRDGDEALKALFPMRLENAPGIAEAIRTRTPAHVPDAWTDARLTDGAREMARKRGYRSLVHVPMVRDGAVLGLIHVSRIESGFFSNHHTSLLTTFADQAVIAIENVRLFNETKEALEQQTATSEILRIISSSPSALVPVFDAILAKATELCEATYGVLWLRDGDAFTMAALHGALPAEQWRTGMVVRPAPGVPLARVVQTGKSVHIVDMRTDEGYRSGAPLPVAAVEVAGMRTLLLVPMLKDNEVIGEVAIYRTEVRAFSDRQIALIENFADQAVIAIENARLFKEIREKSAQLEIANQHKSEFLANMSHELRTPLNAIIGFSEVLSDRMFGEVNEKQLEYLKDIHESGRHLLSLINDILDLSKIEAGRMDLDLSSFDLPGALSNAMTLIRERAQRHGIALALEVDRELGEVQADERKFKQIMLNLLSNAVKFTPDGGKVDVSAKRLNGKVEVAVRDTGIGIAPEDQAAVFEEFKQVGRDRMRKAEGTGLGLALTKRFVELHGGAIRLESAPGKGSTFTVELPLSAGGLRS